MSEPLSEEKVRDAITEVCDEIETLLHEKNAAYGNSALDPVRIFSKASALEQIRVRIDDKLSRLQRGHEYPGDDTLRDIVGYVVLYLVGKRLGLGEVSSMRGSESG